MYLLVLDMLYSMNPNLLFFIQASHVPGAQGLTRGPHA